MGNEFKNLGTHSAEYFGDARDFWWNEDYLRWLLGRWRIDETRTVLDVGCGVGHWGRLLGRVLPEECSFTGVDREPLWAEKASARAGAAGLSHRFRYQVGRAEELPFEENSFDLVTCQTVLMHLRDPGAALREMFRVTRPGGVVLVAEPTHLVAPVLLDAIALNEPAESMAALVRFQLHCQHGKAKSGEGNDLIGEALPALFAAAGLREIEIRLNDRVNPLVPPYESDFAKALVDEAKDLSNRERWMWDRATTRRYFVAGGGEDGAFEAGWQMILAFQRRVTIALAEGSYASAGSGTNYIIRGRKPSAAA